MLTSPPLAKLTRLERLELGKTFVTATNVISSRLRPARFTAQGEPVVVDKSDGTASGTRFESVERIHLIACRVALPDQRELARTLFSAQLDPLDRPLGKGLSRGLSSCSNWLRRDPGSFLNGRRFRSSSNRRIA